MLVISGQQRGQKGRVDSISGGRAVVLAANDARIDGTLDRCAVDCVLWFCVYACMCVCVWCVYAF